MSRREGVTFALWAVLALLGLSVRYHGTVDISKDEDPSRELLFQVDPNTAQADELLALPGIGPALADRILEFRQTNGPFQKAEDLERVYGIGPKKRQQIEPYLLFP